MGLTAGVAMASPVSALRTGAAGLARPVIEETLVLKDAPGVAPEEVSELKGVSSHAR